MSLFQSIFLCWTSAWISFKSLSIKWSRLMLIPKSFLVWCEWTLNGKKIWWWNGERHTTIPKQRHNTFNIKCYRFDQVLEITFACHYKWTCDILTLLGFKVWKVNLVAQWHRLMVPVRVDFGKSNSIYTRI